MWLLSLLLPGYCLYWSVYRARIWYTAVRRYHMLDVWYHKSWMNRSQPAFLLTRFFVVPAARYDRYHCCFFTRRCVFVVCVCLSGCVWLCLSLGVSCVCRQHFFFAVVLPPGEPWPAAAGERVEVSHLRPVLRNSQRGVDAEGLQPAGMMTAQSRHDTTRYIVRSIIYSCTVQARLVLRNNYIHTSSSFETSSTSFEKQLFTYSYKYDYFWETVIYMQVLVVVVVEKQQYYHRFSSVVRPQPFQSKRSRGVV